MLAGMITDYEGKYFSILKQGREENKTTSHKYVKKDEATLLGRMEKYSHKHLLFLHDFSVPLDDNISEMDLWRTKNRQKIARGFHKECRHEMYCFILTIIETLKKRNMGMVENNTRWFNRKAELITFLLVSITKMFVFIKRRWYYKAKMVL